MGSPGWEGKWRVSGGLVLKGELLSAAAAVRAAASLSLPSLGWGVGGGSRTEDVPALRSVPGRT